MNSQHQNMHYNQNTKQQLPQCSYSMIIDTRKQNQKPSDTIIIKQNKRYLMVKPRKILSWIDDNTVTKCYNCSTEFKLFLRRHHCRCCGRIFCYNCSNHYIKVPNYIDMVPNKIILDKTEDKCRVCNHCYLNIEKEKRIRLFSLIFENCYFTIKDYYRLALVCKEWYEIYIQHLSEFRQLQYCLPDYKYTVKERSMLWRNRYLLNGHSCYIVPLIQSISWNNDLHTERTSILNILISPKKDNSCWDLMCSRSCRNFLNLETIIILLYNVPQNILVFHHIIKSLSNYRYFKVSPYLPFLLERLPYCPDQLNSMLYTLLLRYANKDYFFANLMYRYLRYFCILFKDSEHANLYTHCILLLSKNIHNTFYKQIQYGTKWIDNLLNRPDRHNTKNKPDFKPPAKSKTFGFSSPLHPLSTIIAYTISSPVVKNSYSKPIIYTVSGYKGKGVCTKIQKLKVMVKKENVWRDILVLNCIRIMDSILKEEENLNLFLTYYIVLPININTGLIEIVTKSKTLAEITDMKFTILNYILEKNPNLTIEQLRKRFTYSCAGYCVISFLLGIGDRHLDNIMLTDDGYLFHIDFSFLMGKKAKFLAPEIKLTPDMIDAMGGEQSSYYKEFQEICSKAYNCLRRHTSLFFVLLSMLSETSTLLNEKYKIKNIHTPEYIKNQIINRFLPGESSQEAKLIFKTKINRKYSYGEKLIDFCHQQQKTGVVSSIHNAIQHTQQFSKRLYDFFMFRKDLPNNQNKILEI